MNMGFPRLVLVSLLSSLTVDRSTAGRILYLPFPQFSSIQIMTCMKEELKQYGHELWITYPEYLSNHPILQNKDIHFIKLNNLGDVDVDEVMVQQCANIYLNPEGIEPDPDPWIRFQDFIRGSISKRFPPVFIQEAQRTINNKILSDTVLIETLKDKKFDLVVADAVLGMPYSVIPYKIGVPFCYISIMQFPWHSGTPTLPSFIPMTGIGATDRMTFIQRLVSMLLHGAMATVPPYTSEDDVVTFAPEMPPLTLSQLMSKSKMWFVVQDVLVDYPRPLMPNSKLVGGLCSREAKPLPGNFQSFCDRSKHGVVVVSFGGSVKELPKHLFDKLFKAFSLTKYDFVWRTNQKSNVSGKYMMTDWLPQNNLLGHPHTKLFITHGGANGQFESIYHGVPMLGVPLFGDQPYNTRRLERKGYGLELDIHDNSPEDFAQAINTIIQTPSYKENIMKASVIFKDRPLTSRQEAAYWLDYLIKHGDSYIRSIGLDLPWYQYLCVDVLLFMCLVILSVTVFCFKLVKCCWKRLCRTKGDKSKKD